MVIDPIVGVYIPIRWDDHPPPKKNATFDHGTNETWNPGTIRLYESKKVPQKKPTKPTTKGPCCFMTQAVAHIWLPGVARLPIYFVHDWSTGQVPGPRTHLRNKASIRSAISGRVLWGGVGWLAINLVVRPLRRETHWYHGNLRAPPKTIPPQKKNSRPDDQDFFQGSWWVS